MLSRRAIEDLEAIVRSIAVNDGTYPKPQSRTRCDRTGSTARPTAPVRPRVRPHRSDRGPTVLVPMPNAPPFSDPASGARALARARARSRAHQLR